MQKKITNYAFIDNQNIFKGVKSLGWDIDWKSFRIYLKEKFGVKEAYMFIGYIPGNQDLYSKLQKVGYILIFKEVLELRDGTIKGNVDAELVLHTMIEIKNYKKAVIVTGDGDFACLVKYLCKIGKLEKLIVPDIKHYSFLLKKAAAREAILGMNSLKKKIGQ